MAEHITIQSTIPRIRYIADGTLTVFEFPFAIFKDSDLKVYFGETLQESGYTVSGANNSDGGSVTFASAPVADTIITLTRKLNIERISDFQEGGALRANVLNDELDYQIACLQEVADNLNRSMVLPPYAADAEVGLTLPIPAAGKAIVWNSAGTNLENSTVAINELESTVASYKDAAESAKDDAVAAKNTATSKAGEAASSASTASSKASEAAASAAAAASSMSNKASKDMDNLTTTGKGTLINLTMPDYASGVDISGYTSSSNKFTAPKDGILSIYIYANHGAGVFIDDICVADCHGADTSDRCSITIPIGKGSKFYAPAISHSSVFISKFYPVKGE